MPNHAGATSAATALNRVLSAAEWISHARVSMMEPNGDAAAAAYLQHARQRLLEAVALIDQRPRLLAAPQKETRQ